VESCKNVAMRPSIALATQREHVLAIALAHGARNVRVFGSVVTGLDHEGSDLDLLVDMPRGTSLLGVVGLQLDIQDALGVKVDLCTERELHPALRERILAGARAL
jgi:predicted nucleotidyltransferase